MSSILSLYTVISGSLFSQLLAWLTYTFYRLRSETYGAVETFFCIIMTARTRVLLVTF